MGLKCWHISLAKRGCTPVSTYLERYFRWGSCTTQAYSAQTLGGQVPRSNVYALVADSLRGFCWLKALILFTSTFVAWVCFSQWRTSVSSTQRYLALVTLSRGLLMETIRGSDWIPLLGDTADATLCNTQPYLPFILPLLHSSKILL